MSGPPSQPLPKASRPLALRQVLANDYWSFIGLSYPAFTWVGYLFFVLLGRSADWLDRARPAAADSAPVFLLLAIFFTSIGLPMLSWRWFRLSRIQKAGLEVPGKIQQVDFARELIRVEFAYTYHDKPYQVRASVHRTAQTRQVQPRDRVVVVVNRQHPEQAFIRDWMCVPPLGDAQPERAEGSSEHVR